MKELQVILKKDLSRKMVEGIAFSRFEAWWNEQERKHKVGMILCGNVSMEGIFF